MSARSDRIPGIQGLRAVAIILVVAYHLNIPSGAGFIGVDVFFVISGFVITRMVVRRSRDTGRLSLADFWGGRIRRLLPGLAGMILLTVAASALFTSPVGTQPLTATTAVAANAWLSNAFLAVTGAGYFASNAADNPLMHTWSLAVEEQFYLFFPLLVALALWRSRRDGASAKARMTRWILIVTIVSLALCLALTYVELPLPVGGLLAFYSPFTRAWEFGAGALLALAFQRGWTPGPWSRGAVGLGGVLLALGLALAHEGNNFPGWVATLPVAGTTLLLIACVTDSPGVGLLSNRLMVHIGDISYSWYLFHWPVIALMTTAWAGDLPWWSAVPAGVIGWALAEASYRWVEEPFRSRRRFPRLKAPWLAAVVIAPTVIASVGLAVGASSGWGNTSLRSMQAQLDHGQWKYQKVCQSPVPVNQRNMASCRIPGDQSLRPLILVGDSNAGVYAELMVALAHRWDRTVTIATVPSCPVGDAAPVLPDGSNWIDCAKFYQATMDWLATQPPSTVVMASGDTFAYSDLLDLKVRDGEQLHAPNAKSAAWRDSLTRLYQRLDGMGHDVAQVELVPHFPGWRPASCSALEMLRNGTSSCGTSMSLAESDRLQAPALRAEREATRAAGVPLIRVRDVLCRDQVCSTNRGNTWIYEDSAHLSFDGALGLEKTFARTLDR